MIAQEIPDMKKSISKSVRKKNSPQKKQDDIPWLNRYWQLGLFIFINLLIFILVFNTIYTTQYSAVELYFSDASKILAGFLPYRDFTFEYPPLAAIFFLLPRLFTDQYLNYSILYHVEVGICLLIGLWVVFDIARRLGKSPWKLLLVYTFAVLAVGPILGEQFDLFPAVLTLSAIYFFWLGKVKISWLMLALGTMLKIFPIVIAPVFLLLYLRNHQNIQIWKGMITFGLTCLIVISPFLFISPASLSNLLNYHAARGLQLESLYSSLLLIGNKMGITAVKLDFRAGSWNVVGQGSEFMASLSIYIIIAGLLVVYAFIYSRIKPGKSQFSRIGAYSLLAVLVLLIFSKVLSPQYLIWLVPLIPLLFVGWRKAILVVFILTGVLTYYIFPLHYDSLMAMNTGIIIVLLIRNLLLMLMALLIGISLLRMKASD
jgi:uncharacterized membrane protein